MQVFQNVVTASSAEIISKHVESGSTVSCPNLPVVEEEEFFFLVVWATAAAGFREVGCINVELYTTCLLTTNAFLAKLGLGRRLTLSFQSKRPRSNGRVTRQTCWQPSFLSFFDTTEPPSLHR